MQYTTVIAPLSSLRAATRNPLAKSGFNLEIAGQARNDTFLLVIAAATQQ